MKQCPMLLAATMLILTGLAPALQANDGVVLSPDSRRLLSQLQTLGHGYHPAEEWDAVIDDIHATIARAEDAGDAEEMISISLILADVYSDMQGDHARALEVLTDLRTVFEGKPVEGMPRIYAGLAEVYARMGDEAAIRSLIDEFKASPYYDPREHPIQGGENPDTPVTIVRPSAASDNSLTVTMMRRSLREARLAEGRGFPDFEAVDTAGRPVRLADCRGRVLLLDFYVRGWKPWEDRLPVLRDLYRQHRAQGFSILGICVEPRPQGVIAFADEHGMTWPQIAGDTRLPYNLGVGGTSTSFLLDPQGRIVGRDLPPGDLAAAVDRLLGR